MKITIDDNDFEVNYNFTPFQRGSRDTDNIPLEPDEEEEIEILSIELYGCEVADIISDELFDKIAEEALDQLRNNDL
jgi:hypothetical protein